MQREVSECRRVFGLRQQLHMRLQPIREEWLECFEECVFCSAVWDPEEEDVYWCGGTPQVT